MSDKLYKREFEQLLRKIPSLSQKERQHLHSIFGGELSNGMDAVELKQKINSLKYNQDGYGTQEYLDRGELDKLKRKLLDHLG